nr:hypothetical protein [Tanacetum cinerariifolium]
MDSLSPQVVSAAKLPILNPNEFDFWKMRIEQYFLMTDYSLWEVILNGDSPVPTRIVEGVSQLVAPTTAKQRLARKNKLKVRGTLLMALPEKHQLKCNSHKDAKTLMEAIEKLQKLASQLEIHGVSLSQEDVNLNTTDSDSAAASVFAACVKLFASPLPNIDSLSNAVIYSFFASQSTSPQFDNEDLKQIDVDDLKEMDLRWQMAMLTMRARRFLQKTGRNLGASGTASMGFDITKVECYNCHRKGYFARECRSPKDQRRPSTAEPQRRTSYQAEEEPANFALMDFSSNSSSSSSDNEPGLESVEARLLVYKQNESVFEENIKLLNIEVQLRYIALVTLRQKLEKAEQERDDLKLKLEKFQTSSKNLTALLASQTSEKAELGYNSYVFTQAMFDCTNYYSFKSDYESWPPSNLYDRFIPSGGYHVVPPPYTGTFMPPKPDLVFNTAPFILRQTTLPLMFSLVPLSLNKTCLTHLDLVHLSLKTRSLILRRNLSPKTHSTSPKSNSSGKRRNRKACFVCKSVDHLIKDCDFHAKKMAKPAQRNYANRGYHKQYAPKPLKHSIPTAVLTQSKPVSNTAVRPDLSSRPTSPIIEDWVSDTEEDDMPQVTKDVPRFA